MSLNNRTLRNLAIVSIAFVVFALNFAVSVESAQTKTTVKATPTPVKKKTTPTPAKTAKPAATAAKTTPTPAKSPTPAKKAQIITMVAGARVRSQASTGSAEVRRMKMGTLINILSVTSNNWFKIEIPAKPKPIIGWMSGQVAANYDPAKKEETYRQIVDRNFKPDGMSFLDASELVEFLTIAQTEIKNPKLVPDFSFKRLLALSLALKAIPSDKYAEKQYKDFFKKYDSEVVYSEPSGEWYVRSVKFWDLRKKYATLPIAEEIAWAATQNPLPGECEGYINCYLFAMRETDARYLEFFPSGKYSLEALKNLQNLLEPMLADVAEKQVYNGPTDVSDRAEFNRMIAEIRTIVSKLTLAEYEKQKMIQQLNQLAEGFR